MARNVTKHLFQLVLGVGLIAVFGITQAHGRNKYSNCKEVEQFIKLYKKSAETRISNSQQDECSANNFYVFLGFGSNCGGQNVCTAATFSSSKIASPIQSRLDSSLGMLAKEVALSDDKVGYFVAPRCGAYCDEAKIIWFQKDSVFIIGLKTAKDDADTINELVKSANSYIAK